MGILINTVILLHIFILTVQSQTSCKTPDDEDGTCIPAINCKFIADLIRNRTISREELKELLNPYKCEISKACCPLEVIPNHPSRINSELNADLLPREGECGIFEENKIFGGTGTSIYDFPWSVILDYRGRDGKKAFKCGGSLINDRYVLTAAHCVRLRGANWKLLSVRLGDNDFNQENDCNEWECNSPIDVSVAEAIVHENYTRATRGDDIALLRLRRNVAYSKFINPVCLPKEIEREEDLVGRYPSSTGWGVTENGSSSSIKLRVEVPLLSQEQCRKTFEAVTPIIDTQICAGGEAGKDSCAGDSGGALSLKDNRNRWNLIGIISFGRRNCGEEGFPGVHTRVSMYRDWILDKIRP